MLNAAYARKLAVEELEDTLRWGDLIDRNEDPRERTKDRNGKDCYLLRFIKGSVVVYSPNSILINGVKHKSVSDAKRAIQFNFVR